MRSNAQNPFFLIIIRVIMCNKHTFLIFALFGLFCTLLLLFNEDAVAPAHALLLLLLLRSPSSLNIKTIKKKYFQTIKMTLPTLVGHVSIIFRYFILNTNNIFLTAIKQSKYVYLIDIRELTDNLLTDLV